MSTPSQECQLDGTILGNILSELNDAEQAKLASEAADLEAAAMTLGTSTRPFDKVAYLKGIQVLARPSGHYALEASGISEAQPE